MLSSVMPRSPTAWVALAAALLGGCGYTSQYAAPADGRARAVWREDNVVIERADAPVTPECQEEVVALATGQRPPPPPPASGYAPRYYGPPLIVIVPGLAPRPPLPMLFSPSLALTGAAARVGRPPVRAGLGGGGNSTRGLEAAAVYLAVVALLALPVIDMAVALGPAESPGKSSAAIDEVNALNELLRWPGSPCWPGAEGPGGPGGADRSVGP